MRLDILSSIGLFCILIAPFAGGAQTGRDAAAALPRMIPIFPLADVMLFPNSTRPLHIFEARYGEMVADALASDSIIGMVLLQPGFESEYEGRPPVYAVGCAGVIVAVEELPDGRYNIVLDGLVKFRVMGEDSSRSYRRARVEALPEVVEGSEREMLGRSRRRLEEVVRAVAPRVQVPPELPDEELIDVLSAFLPLEPLSRQELLEADGPVQRVSMLIGLLGGSARGFAPSN